MILLSRIYGQPGIRLLRNNRVIEGTSVYPNVPDNLLGTKNKYAAQRIYGELELNDFPVDFMKTRFNDNMKDLFGEISKRLSNYHYNILKQATGFRKGEINKPENKSLVDEMLATMTPVCADSPEPAVEPEPENTPGSHGINNPSPTGGQAGSSGGNTRNPGGTTGNTNGGSPVPTGPIPNPALNGGRNNSDKYEPLPENRIELSETLRGVFARFPGDKLSQLYTSLCTISLKKHAVMCYVAAWSLLESWSSAMGKNDSTDFVSFLGSKLNKFEPDRGKKNALRQVIQDIHGKGNCNKHSGIFGNNHAMDLKNYFIILEPFLIYETEQYFL